MHRSQSKTESTSPWRFGPCWQIWRRALAHSRYVRCLSVMVLHVNPKISSRNPRYFLYLSTLCFCFSLKSDTWVEYVWFFLHFPFSSAVNESRVWPHYWPSNCHTTDHHKLRHVPRRAQLFWGKLQSNNLSLINFTSSYCKYPLLVPHVIHVTSSLMSLSITFRPTSVALLSSGGRMFMTSGTLTSLSSLTVMAGRSWRELEIYLNKRWMAALLSSLRVSRFVRITVTMWIHYFSRFYFFLSNMYIPAIYLLYAKLEEGYGLARHAMAVYERATQAVETEERHHMFNIYIKRAAEIYGVTYTRAIYQKAIEVKRLKALVNVAPSHVTVFFPV